MKKILRNVCLVAHRSLILTGILLVVFCFSAVVEAQQPTATITSLSGEVLVSIQGKAPVAAKVGTVLTRGDMIQTQTAANVVLTLSDGSELQLGENTKVAMIVLTQEPTGARVSKLKLAWGRIQAFLSPGHQKEGSSFDVETPNTIVGVKFSQPDVEVSYDPETETTIVRAYTVDISVLNLVTKAEVKQMPKEHQAIIRDEFILVTRITEMSRIIEQLRQMIQDEEALAEPEPTESLQDLGQSKMNLLLATQQGVSASVSSAPGFSEETSQRPDPGTATGSSGNGRQPLDFTFTVTER